jgi:hypothetical protein
MSATGLTGTGPWRAVIDMIELQIAGLTQEGNPPAKVKVLDQNGNPILIYNVGSVLTNPTGSPGAQPRLLFLDAQGETISSRGIDL